jgi:hypothetical protein
MWCARLVAVTIGLILGAPAAAETLRVEGVFAATAREASYLPTIGVDPVTGPVGEEVGIAIERQLQDLDDSDVPHPRLVPPSLRPDGLLTGSTDIAVDDNDYIEARERCVEKKDDKCVRRVKYRVRCTRRSVSLRVDLRLVRQRDGRTVYAGPKTRESNGWWCEDSGIPLDVQLTASSLGESVAREVRGDLAPHRERYKVRVQEDRKALPPELADRFRQAVRLTKTDEAAACRAFAEIDRLSPDHGATVFNLALCAEAAGQYPLAADLYSRARVFAPQAGGEVSKGLGRVRSLADGAEDVRRIAAL